MGFMTKLHQILAVEKGVKKTSHERITDAYQTLQKPALLGGISRVYRAADEDGIVLPSEHQKVQVSAGTVLDDVRQELERLWDVTATREFANTEAKADVIVDGATLMSGVPATYLLWLEKQLTDIHTVVSKLPTLDPGEDWEWSSEQDCYASRPSETRSSKKVPRVLVKVEATKEHPAQTEVYTEDVVVGFWETVKYSGSLPAENVRKMTDRVNKLKEAVRVARAEANSHDVTDKKIADTALDYVFNNG